MRSVLITGATSGLGRASAQRFAANGWHVIVGGRRSAVVEEQVAAIESSGGKASAFVADLASLGDVRRAVAAFEWPALGGIVANAGIVLTDWRSSEDGFELTFAVNVLAHQLIVGGLLEHLEPKARIVFVTSGTQLPDHKLARRAGIPPPRWLGVDALVRPEVVAEQLTNPRQDYTTSKLGNVLQVRAFQAYLLATRRDVDVFAIDPGVMPETNLQRGAPAARRFAARTVGVVLTRFIDGMRRVGTSAGHVVNLVEDEALSGKGFTYFDGDQPFPASADGMNDAYRDSLWTDANRLVGLDLPIALLDRAPTG